MKEFKVPRADKPNLDFALTFDRFIPGEPADEAGGTPATEDHWEEQTEKFQARGQIPGNLLVSLTASMNSGVGVQAHELQRLLTSALVPTDRERFVKLLDDGDTAVPIEMLGEIAEWLAVEYSNRPT
jgi:hypothetical protein